MVSSVLTGSYCGVLGGSGARALVELHSRVVSRCGAVCDSDVPDFLLVNHGVCGSDFSGVVVDSESEALLGLLGSVCSEVFIACNTAYLWFDSLVGLCPGLVNVPEVTFSRVCSAAPVVFQSAMSRDGGLYARYGDVVLGDQCITDEAIDAVLRGEVHDGFVSHVYDLVSSGFEVVLGCTELSVLFPRRVRGVVDSLDVIVSGVLRDRVAAGGVLS